MGLTKREKPKDYTCPPWMLTFGDLVQQVLVFFVLLFSLSELRSPEKLKETADSVRKAFDGKAGAGQGSPMMILFTQDKVSGTVTDQIDGKNKVAKKIREGLKINIGDYVWFDEGKAEFKDPDEAIRLIEAMIKEFKGFPNVIEIRGFTSANKEDSVDGDHWLLSFQRANYVAKRLIGDTPGNWIIDPKRIRITGCGKNDPVAENKVPSERAKNRRIEIVVMSEVIVQ
jgi:chemotaxis protein MotB